jgi:hypothetical protein
MDNTRICKCNILRKTYWWQPYSLSLKLSPASGPSILIASLSYALAASSSLSNDPMCLARFSSLVHSSLFRDQGLWLTVQVSKLTQCASHASAPCPSAYSGIRAYGLRFRVQVSKTTQCASHASAPCPLQLI